MKVLTLQMQVWDHWINLRILASTPCKPTFRVCLLDPSREQNFKISSKRKFCSGCPYEHPVKTPVTRKSSESVSGVFPVFFWNFFQEVPAVLGVSPNDPFSRQRFSQLWGDFWRTCLKECFMEMLQHKIDQKHVDQHQLQCPLCRNAEITDMQVYGALKDSSTIVWEKDPFSYRACFTAAFRCMPKAQGVIRQHTILRRGFLERGSQKGS